MCHCTLLLLRAWFSTKCKCKKKIHKYSSKLFQNNPKLSGCSHKILSIFYFTLSITKPPAFKGLFRCGFIASRGFNINTVVNDTWHVTNDTCVIKHSIWHGAIFSSSFLCLNLIEFYVFSDTIHTWQDIQCALHARFVS